MKKVEFLKVRSELSGYGFGKGARYSFEGVEETIRQDYHHYTEIMEFLKSLNDQGVTIIMITHDMHLMLEYTPHAIVISDGQKIGDSTAVRILTNEEIAASANLKLTSLYDLAVACGIEDA